MSPIPFSLSSPASASSVRAPTGRPVSLSQPLGGSGDVGSGVTVSGVFKTRGQRFSNRIAIQVGRLAKKKYVEERGEAAGRRLTKRKPRDQAFKEYVYPSSYGRVVYEAFDSVVLSLMS